MVWDEYENVEIFGYTEIKLWRSGKFRQDYRKNPKIWDTRKICYNHPKILTKWLFHRVMCPKDADVMANSVDPDQTAQSDLGLHCLPRPVCPKT